MNDLVSFEMSKCSVSNTFWNDTTFYMDKACSILKNWKSEKDL